MRFEVFHPGLLGRPDIIAVDMIHHPGLWGLCFSHHPPNNNHPRYAADTTTEGVLRFLECAQEGRDGVRLSDIADYTVTTHHLDADSVLPVWALLNPEAALARRDLLTRVARSGDFFLYLDKTSARINATIEGLHWRLRGKGRPGERLIEDNLTRACFDWLLPRMESLLDDPTPYREYWEAPLNAQQQDRDYLQESNRITELWDSHLSHVVTDHDPEVAALNTLCRNDLLLIWRTDSQERRLEVRPAIAWYELTSLPHRPCYDLASLADSLNIAEDAHAWSHQPGPSTLQATRSNLSQEKVHDVIHAWLQLQPERNLPAVYRADTAQVFRFHSQHHTFDCQRRFADAAELRYRPGAPYEGLYPLDMTAHRQTNKTLWITGGKTPVSFAVADSFYWNRTRPEPLELEITCEDLAVGKLGIEYDTWETPLQPTPSVTLCNDGQIKTARFLLPDARLGATQPQGADFRLTRSPGTRLALKEIVLCKQPNPF
jgi:hypothetical protein